MASSYLHNIRYTMKKEKRKRHREEKTRCNKITEGKEGVEIIQSAKRKEIRETTDFCKRNIWERNQGGSKIIINPIVKLPTKVIPNITSRFTFLLM